MEKDTKFITGLKAFGAIMVVVSHLKMQFSGYTDITFKFITFAPYFIMLFIAISAFTISMSIDKQKEFKFFSYFKRRYFRIAPSYYVAVVLTFLMRTAINGVTYFHNAFPSLFYIFLFLNFEPIHADSQASILSVEWMIPILFWFYFFIPPCLYLIRNYFPIFCFILLGAIFLHFHPDIFFTYKGFGGFKWSFQFYLLPYVYTILIYALHKDRLNILSSRKRNYFVFMLYLLAIGFCYILFLYYIGNRSEQMYGTILLLISLYLIWMKKIIIRFCEKISRKLFFLVNNFDVVVLFIMLLKYMINLYHINNPHIILTFLFVDLILAGFYRPFIMRILFENRIMQFLGVISFGIYLIHPIVITVVERLVSMEYPLIRLFGIFSLTVICAKILYAKVENPFSTYFSSKRFIFKRDNI